MGVQYMIAGTCRGLLADFVILDRNPLQIPITEVHQTRASQVFIQDEPVHSRD